MSSYDFQFPVGKLDNRKALGELTPRRKTRASSLAAEPDSHDKHDKGWGDGSASKLLAIQAWGPEFRST